MPQAVALERMDVLRKYGLTRSSASRPIDHRQLLPGKYIGRIIQLLHQPNGGGLLGTFDPGTYPDHLGDIQIAVQRNKKGWEKYLITFRASIKVKADGRGPFEESLAMNLLTSISALTGEVQGAAVSVSVHCEEADLRSPLPVPFLVGLEIDGVADR